MALARKTRTQNAAIRGDEFMWCRTFGHDWEEWHTNRVPEFGYYESVHCPRCTTERMFTISLVGDVISRRYVYPEGYRLGFRLNRADARRELRKRGWFDGEARKQAVKTTVRKRKAA